MKILILLCALIALPLQAEVRGEKVLIDHNPELQLFSFKAIILKGAKWTRPLIVEELQKVNRIYSQCGVQIKHIELLNAQTSADFSELDQVALYGSKLEKIGFKKRDEVVALFAGKLVGDLREQGGSNTGGFAINELNMQDATTLEQAMTNMAVLLDHGHSDEYKNKRHPEYSPIAHELGHIYLNEGHAETANLMASGVEIVTPELTPEQCKTFRQSPLIKN